MTDREEILERMNEMGVVAVIRAESSESLLDVAKALEEGGVNVMEITMNTPNALEAIKGISREMGEQLILGAGTVLDRSAAEKAISAGAEFVVSPIFKPEIVEVAKRHNKVVMPGGFTPTEVLTAWEGGADVVKVFPVSGVGPGYIKVLKAPLPHIRLMPMGGVNLDTAAEFIKAGAEFLGVGGALANKADIAAGNFQKISETAPKFVEIIKAARNTA